MISVMLACDDPYETAELFTKQLGWTLVFATPPESGDPLACVSLADGEVMLGVADERLLSAASRDHRGAGVTVYIRLSGAEDIRVIHDCHAEAGVVVEPLATRPWGERAFTAVITGYRFLIAQEI